jgi:hypothetical protein
MEKAFGTALAPTPLKKKGTARVALVDLKDATAMDRLTQEKFEACVLSLAPGAEEIMEAARSSPSNSRLVLYGIGGNAKQAMKFSKYGINAMFQEPLERPGALKLVRATHMLVLHEFRRYARIPIMTEVTIVSGDGHRLSATSVDVSSGGMSLKSSEDMPTGTNVEVSFSLLTLPRVTIRGAVTWRKSKSFGIRFESGDDRRQGIKKWIDAYLES